MKTQITLIDDQDVGFEVDWIVTDDAGKTTGFSKIFPVRPQGTEQMAYAEQCVAGKVAEQ